MLSRWASSIVPLPPADIEVACYGYEGIDAVKDALRAGLSCSTEAMPIKVMLPPQPVNAVTETSQLKTFMG